MLLISHYLPVQTHHNNYRPTFSNFFDKVKKSKVNYTVLLQHYGNEFNTASRY